MSVQREMFGFTVALEKMQEGLSVARSVWSNANYIFLKDGKFYRRSFSPNKGIVEYTLLNSDILSNDWYVTSTPVTFLEALEAAMLGRKINNHTGSNNHYYTLNDKGELLRNPWDGRTGLAVVLTIKEYMDDWWIINESNPSK